VGASLRRREPVVSRAGETGDRERGFGTIKPEGTALRTPLGLGAAARFRRDRPREPLRASAAAAGLDAAEARARLPSLAGDAEPEGPKNGSSRRCGSCGGALTPRLGRAEWRAGEAAMPAGDGARDAAERAARLRAGVTAAIPSRASKPKAGVRLPCLASGSRRLDGVVAEGSQGSGLSGPAMLGEAECEACFSATRRCGRRAPRGAGGDDDPRPGPPSCRVGPSRPVPLRRPPSKPSVPESTSYDGTAPCCLASRSVAPSELMPAGAAARRTLARRPPPGRPRASEPSAISMMCPLVCGRAASAQEACIPGRYQGRLRLCGRAREGGRSLGPGGQGWARRTACVTV